MTNLWNVSSYIIYSICILFHKISFVLILLCKTFYLHLNKKWKLTQIVSHHIIFNWNTSIIRKICLDISNIYRRNAVCTLFDNFFLHLFLNQYWAGKFLWTIGENVTWYIDPATDRLHFLPFQVSESII